TSYSAATHFEGVTVSTQPKIDTPLQTKWLPKLLGFDYEISYNKGSENVVADALSRLTHGGELNSLMILIYKRSLQAREAAIEMVKFHITGAQNRMKKYVDLKRSEGEFALGM
nr:reverse transcriptase [Tanacetum cinerariifolium]